MHTLDVRSIRKSFGTKPILVDIDFTCKTGDVMAIFGRNGSGKSTLLKILLGTFKANRREIYFDER